MKNKLYLEAPNYHEAGFNFLDKSVFLGGSISGAGDWQKDVADKLIKYFHVFNPRRKDYNSLDPKVEREQITWEDFYLKRAEILLFYFSWETLAPITLFEYGKYLALARYTPWRKIYVCVHPEYKRKNDIYIQTELENPEIAKNIFDNLDDLCETVIRNNKKI